MVGIRCCYILGSSDLATPSLQTLPHPHCSELPLPDPSLSHHVGSNIPRWVSGWHGARFLPSPAPAHISLMFNPGLCLKHVLTCTWLFGQSHYLVESRAPVRVGIFEVLLGGRNKLTPRLLTLSLSISVLLLTLLLTGSGPGSRKSFPLHTVRERLLCIGLMFISNQCMGPGKAWPDVLHLCSLALLLLNRSSELIEMCCVGLGRRKGTQQRNHSCPGSVSLLPFPHLA